MPAASWRPRKSSAASRRVGVRRRHVCRLPTAPASRSSSPRHSGGGAMRPHNELREADLAETLDHGAQPGQPDRDQLAQRPAPGPPGQRRRGERRHVGALGRVGQADPEVLRADGAPVLGRHRLYHRLAVGGVARRAEGGDPPVGQPAAPLERRGHVAAQPHVEGVLGRTRRDGHPRERARRPVVADLLAGPQAPQHRQRVVHLRRPVRSAEADGAALTAEHQPRHEGQEEAATRQAVQRGHRLGQSDQVAPGQQHGGPDLERRAGTRDPGQADQRVRPRAGQDLGQPQRVEPGLGDALGRGPPCPRRPGSRRRR